MTEAPAACTYNPDAPALPPGQLGELLDLVRQYLDLEPGEETFIICALAAAVSKALDTEEPLWLFLIGPPGGGKTEAIRILTPLANYRVDELTRAGLLSRDKKGKRVGLLTMIPRSALVTISDFSTVATMGDREARARMYGMLRVVYDGHVYRSIGGDVSLVGEELEWSGHLTLIAGATPAIDTHTSMETALGERWLTVRLRESTAERSRRKARFVLKRDHVNELQQKAQEKTEEIILRARLRIPHILGEESRDALAAAATFIATARTGVPFEGQGRARVPVGLPVPEEPTRLVGQLSRLARCLVALELPEPAAVRVATRAAIDSVPLGRMRALAEVADSDEAGTTVAAVHRALGRGSRWAALWELDALDAIGLLEVHGPTRDEDPNATRLYKLRDEWSQTWAEILQPVNKSLTELYQNEASFSRTPIDKRGDRLRLRTPPEQPTNSYTQNGQDPQTTIDSDIPF